jgi:hypothetical protein
VKQEGGTEDVFLEADDDLITVKQLLVLAFLSVLFIWACAPARQKKTTLEIPFKKIDHFMVGRYEVGALEYEPYMLPSGYIQLYYFPVYIEGKRIRDFYVNLYGNPEDFFVFGKKRPKKTLILSRKDMRVRSNTKGSKKTL